MRVILAIAITATVSACGGLEPRRPDGQTGLFAMLGPTGNVTTSGRPATQPLPPISRQSDNSDRKPIVENGTGQFVDERSRRPIETSDGGKTISLNFVDVELQEFVRVVFDEILKETVVVDPGLKGRITIRTTAPVSRAGAMDLVRQALQANGASLAKANGVYRVTARSDQRGSRQLGESIRIIPLRYIGAEEAKAALSPFLQGGAEVSASSTGQYLTISGPPLEIDNLEQVIATLDIDQMKGMSIALLPLREAGAAAVATELSNVLGKGANTDSRMLRVIPITRINAVLVLSTRPQLISRARRWVSNLDRAAWDGRQIHVYPVQNRRAPEIAKVLAAMWERGRDAAGDTQNRPVAPSLTPLSSPPNARPSTFGSIPTPAANAPVVDNPPGNFDQDAKAQGPRISADPAINSIVVIANVEEWKVIEAALRRLDVAAPQVLIEATIAEVRLNNTLSHGVRWYFESGAHSITLTDASDGSVAPVFPGFNYVLNTPKGKLVLNALEQVTDVEIVSSPALTVLDNQTAKLQVGDQVPIATRSAQSVVNPEAPIVNDIEFKDTGVILAVTPHVNASGLVVLDITQEASDVVPTTTSTLQSPTIRQRRINSSVAVHSGAEIVLGGMIAVNRTKTGSGMPFLMDIPIIGNAFKAQATRQNDRTELLVILRPTVMGNGLDVQNVTREIKSRMSGSGGAAYR